MPGRVNKLGNYAGLTLTSAVNTTADGQDITILGEAGISGNNLTIQLEMNKGLFDFLLETPIKDLTLQVFNWFPVKLNRAFRSPVFLCLVLAQRPGTYPNNENEFCT